MRAITSIGAATTIVMLLGCTTVGTSDDNPFATGTPTTMTSALPGTDSGSGEDSTGSGDGGGTSSGGGQSSSGGADSTGPLTTGPMMTTGVSMGSTDDGGNGMQPAMGMWAACAVPEDCSYSPALCIAITDDMMNLLGGFCSDVGCTNPAVDCDPSPNGIAVPVCVGVTVNGMADTACALQCTGGLACPAPMQCINVTGIGEICA